MAKVESFKKIMPKMLPSRKSMQESMNSAKALDKAKKSGTIDKFFKDVDRTFGEMKKRRLKKQI